MKYGILIFFATFFILLFQAPFLFNDKPDELMFIPLVLIIGLGATFFLNKSSDKVDAEFQVNIFLVAFSLRIMLGIIIYGWDLTGVFGDEDSTGYISGWYVAQNWYKNGIDGFIADLYLVFIGKQNIGQNIIWGFLMFIANGPSRMIVSVINSFAGSMLVIVVYRIAKKIFDFQTAKVAAVLTTFWLSIVLLSAATSKEMLVICLEWSILYLAIRNPKGLSQKDIITAAFLMIVLYTLRFYAFYMCAAALFFRAIIANSKNYARNSILGFILIASLLILLNASGAINKDFERLDRQNQIIDLWRVNVATSTGSGTDIYSQYKGNSILAVSVATVYFFFAPFPWDIFSGSLRSSFAAVENIIIIFVFAIGFTSIKTLFKERFFQLLPLIVFSVLYAGLQIWGLSNIGLAWRHRQTIMPLFFLLAALSITKNFRKRLFSVA
jgi:uncharacterized membrane protein YeaQ/YmgE (transglycosylase-associated protein family)